MWGHMCLGLACGPEGLALWTPKDDQGLASSMRTEIKSQELSYLAGWWAVTTVCSPPRVL